ncbi:MAG TPA: alpha/beta fold hydrolase [Vicinamibacterales bacterium]
MTLALSRDFCADEDASASPADHPPTDAVELRLADLWEDAFGRRPASVTADVFELGGHSFRSSARLGMLIEKAFGIQFPLATFLTAATLGEQANLVRRPQEVQTEWPSLVPIRESGSKPPLFFVHMADGHVLSYRDLMRHLPTDQPLYGLQSRGLDGTSPINTRIEDMARDYVAEIRRAYPCGPYAICGWSFGGTVAFEMARQLEQQQRRVALLALFDTRVPTQTVRRRQAKRIWIRTLRTPVHISRVLAYVKGWLRRPDPAPVTASVEARVWESLALEYQREFRLPPTLENVLKANKKALHDYVPRAYGGRVTVIRALHRLSQRSRDPLLGWGTLSIGDLELHEVAGSHLSLLFEPHVRSLAEKLTQCLNRAWSEALNV